MKVGVFISTNVDGADMKTVAPYVEALGFESLWVPEHPAFPKNFHSEYGGGRVFPEANKQMLDPFVALAAAAGATESLRLGTAVVLVPERNPLLMAKEVASLDHVSGGRLFFGIGAGWLREEGEVLGADWPRRWTQTREYVLAMKALWAPGTNRFDGKYVKFPELYCHPKPLQTPHPPILVGGEQARAAERVAEYGDGWLPRHVMTNPRQVEAGLHRIHALCRERGRDPVGIEVSMFDCEPTRQAYRDYGNAGATRIVQVLPFADREGTLIQIDRLADAVL